MSTSHIFAGAALVAMFLVGCSKDSGEQLHSVTPSSSLNGSQTTKSRLEEIQKDYGVTVDIHDRWIIIGTSGLITTNIMNQISGALHEVFGENFTNYTINYDIH
jgi:hypothetical protein